MTKLRQLGKNGPKVNPLGLGCMGMSEFYGPTDNVENVRVLERALDLGCTFWDTADMYGHGRNERLLSQIIKKHRDQIFICTKFGALRDPQTGEICGVSGKPEYVRTACEQSLQRLGVDVIDLYYQYRLDPETPIEETVQAMANLVKEGKVRYLGLTECSADMLRRAYKVHPITAVQVEYSPWSMEIETNGLLDAARELGVAIVCYGTLGQGMLAGSISSIDDLDEDDSRRTLPRFSPENFSRNVQLAKKIQALAAKKGIPPSVLVLAWILNQGPEFFVTPGTKRMKHFEQNFKAGQLKLSKAEMDEMRKMVESARPYGATYSEYVRTTRGM
ncbi:aldo/keto reductase [Fennellomyces sp. T-0311]|nr:aldo/keto reductase [Fennellomyces sp. T-0311]